MKRTALPVLVLAALLAGCGASVKMAAPTIPTPGIPYLGYKFTPRGNDWTYGLASLFFAALAYRKLEREGRLP